MNWVVEKQPRASPGSGAAIKQSINIHYRTIKYLTVTVPRLNKPSPT
jgi:hypothetical protein